MEESGRVEVRVERGRVERAGWREESREGRVERGRVEDGGERESGKGRGLKYQREGRKRKRGEQKRRERVIWSWGEVEGKERVREEGRVGKGV
ncbi:UNVERIFIED_CONTAM: hypothetical protein FKN15_028809 [Acipenser sinensis]